MRVSPRSSSCAVLGVVVALSSPVASAGDDGYRDVERRSGLELDGVWQDYQRRGETRPFAEFVEAKYRRQRDIGRGLLFGGLGLGVTGSAMFFLALPRNDAAGVTYASYAVLGVSVGMIIAGSVMWHRNFRRLERLETSGLALGRRLQLRGAGPIGLRRGAGVGLHFAF